MKWTTRYEDVEQDNYLRFKEDKGQKSYFCFGYSKVWSLDQSDKWNYYFDIMY